MSQPVLRKMSVMVAACLCAFLLAGIRMTVSGEPLDDWKRTQEQSVKEYVETSDRAVSEWESRRRRLIENWKQEKDQALRDFRREREKLLRVWRDENEAIIKVWKEKQDSTVLKWMEYGAAYRTETNFESGELRVSGAVLVDAGEDVEKAKEKAYRIALLKLNDQVLALKPTNKESLKELGRKKQPGLSDQVDQFVARHTDPEQEEEKIEPVAGTDQSLVRVEVKTSLVREGMKKLIDPVVEAETGDMQKFTFAEKMAAALQERLKQEGPYTGLLIDAREIALTPCLAPEIVTEDGRRVYGMGIAEERYVAQTGVVGWTKTIKPARVNIRIGEKPLTVEAKNIRSGNQVIISSEDAHLVSFADSEFSFMPKGRVVIAVD